MIAGFEGYLGEARWDVNAWRVGYGSDTEGPNGLPVRQGTRTTRARAWQNLLRRVPEFQQVVAKAIGPTTWNKLNINERAALTSIAYNYGRLPRRVKVLPSVPEVTAESIRSLASDNGGVNRRRRLAEADFYLKPVPSGASTGAVLGGAAVLLHQLGGPVVLVLTALAGAVLCWSIALVKGQRSSAAAQLSAALAQRAQLDRKIEALRAEIRAEIDERLALLDGGDEK